VSTSLSWWALIGVFVAAPATGAEGWFLTAVEGAVLRETPSQEARALAALPIGTALRGTDRSPTEETIAGLTARWHRVTVSRRELPAGRAAGWVFGALLVPLDPARPEAALRAVVEARAGAHGERPWPAPEAARRFREQVALENAALELMAEAPAPELELLRLELVDAAAGLLVAAGIDDPLHRSWLLARRELLAYFDPGDLWLVRPQAWWQLYERHRESPAAERLAWMASRGAPHDWEGDPLDALEITLASFGRYLELYPAGEHVAEVVSRMEPLLSAAAQIACSEGSAPAALATRLAELRRLLEPVAAELTAIIRADLERIAVQCALEVAPPPTENAAGTPSRAVATSGLLAGAGSGKALALLAQPDVAGGPRCPPRLALPLQRGPWHHHRDVAVLEGHDRGRLCPRSGPHHPDRRREADRSTHRARHRDSQAAAGDPRRRCRRLHRSGG
jgi:hypothetical protein